MGLRSAAGSLIKLRQRQRGAQFETARALLLGDCDGSQEGVLRGAWVGVVAIQQDLAARPVEFRFERAIAHAVACRQRFIEDRDGAD